MIPFSSLKILVNKTKYFNLSFVPDKALDQPSEGGPFLILVPLDPEHLVVAEHPDVLHLLALLVGDPELAILILPQEISPARLITQQLHGFLKVKTY